MSFGTSPTAPSLLIPSNPAFSSVDSVPRGGILINVQRASEPTLSIDTGLVQGSFSGRRPSDPSSPLTEGESSPIPSPNLSNSNNGKLLKIRFAPLPDPRRPRSLSTGRNIQWTNQVDENGLEKRSLAIKDHNTDDYAVEDDEEEEENSEEIRRRYIGENDNGEDDEDEDENGERKSRRWSKSMGLGSSWKGTKKLLTGKNPFEQSTKEKEKEDISAYGQGAPLKKSVSTGGFIGSSPFRWTLETERKNTMQGSSPPTVTSLLSTHRASATAIPSGHRRNSSLEPGMSPSAKRSSSPSTTPIKLMNGRVYGSRRASEAAERQKQIREKNEPAFVEWGQGSVATHSTEEGGNRGFLGDNDDGGGMAWVKRRREERQKKEREERERKEQEELERGTSQDESNESSPTDDKGSSSNIGIGLSSSQSSTSSLELGIKSEIKSPQYSLKTPAIATSELPPTPIIRVIDSDTIHSPIAQHSSTQRQDLEVDIGPKGERMTPTPPITSTTTGTMNLGLGDSLPLPSKATGLIEERREGDHVVQAMRIPSDSVKRSQNQNQNQYQSKSNKHQLSDPFGQDSPTNERNNPSESDEDDEGEEEDDGDFDDDEDEEIDDIRTTSSAAGVEVISRHK